MKKLFAIPVIILIACNSFAQESKSTTKSSGTNFGITAGVDMRNMYGKESNGDKTDGDIAVKYHVGVNVEVPIGKDLVFQPGLTFAAKGTQQKGTFLTVSYKQNVNVFYLDIPMNFVYKPLLGTGHLLLGGGPYIGFGVGGKVTTKSGSTEETADVEFRNTVKTSDPDDKAYLKRMDAGLNFLAGYEFTNRFSVQLNTSLGLMNVSPSYEGQSSDKSTAKHIGFGVSFGYRFGK